MSYRQRYAAPPTEARVYAFWQRLGFVSFACVYLFFGSVPSAYAFRCSQATQLNQTAGPSLAWPTRQLTYSLNTAGTQQLPTAQTFAVLRSAFTVWQGMRLSADANAMCGGDAVQTDITFTEGPMSDESWTGYDYLDPQRNTNLLVFRDTSWTVDPTSSDIIALTTTTYSALTGIIIDADIEFNSAQTAFALADPNDSQLDLLSTAVHEVGHFLGLAHCTADPTATCGHNEVMEPVGFAGQISKRQLACDDRAGLVFKYGLGLANGYCTDVTNCASGCLPPVLPAQTPIITQAKSDMGRGCQQASVPPVSAAVVAGAVLWRLVRARRRHVLQLTLAALGLVTLASCQTQATDCGGNPMVFNANAPLILSMGMVRQVTSDPWHVVLAVDFVDPDGDLSGGSAHFYANHSKTATQSFTMSDIFESTGGLALDATNGRIQMLVRLLSTTPSGAVLHLSTQLVDAQGHVSNCFGLDLNYALQASNPNALLQLP